ncbi:MAG TPA: ABC transporter ATP-binding protein [Arenicellales bacterium]|nr:ABC transporter ATP-binding protein [Arenicellales bacterium]
MTAEPLLAIRDLRVTFPMFRRTVHAINGCSLSVESGRIVGLVGESGSGKSVTALASLGLLPPSAGVRGSIRLAGREIVGCSSDTLASVRGGTAAMIFQNPTTALNPYFTIGRQMADVIRLHRERDARRALARAEEALAQTGLPDAAAQLDKYPHQLSGGQLQRVMIAMALACEPALLIADEPTTALDVTVQAQIIVLLRDLAERTGLSVLFITHDLGVVASLCDSVTVMYAGSVVEHGAVGDIFDHPAHPYTRKLMDTVPMLGTGRRDFVAIAGQVPDLSRLPAGCPFHPRCELATETCSREAPAWQDIGTGHGAACHYPERPLHQVANGNRSAVK